MKYVGGGAAWKSVWVLIVDPASESLSGSIPVYFVHLWRLRAEKMKLTSLALVFDTRRCGSVHAAVSSRNRVNVPFSMKPNWVFPLLSRTATARACIHNGASFEYVPKQLFRLWHRMRSVPLFRLKPPLWSNSAVKRSLRWKSSTPVCNAV